MGFFSESTLPWVILALAACNVIFLGGKRRAFGIFVAQLRYEYNTTSLAELNWIGDSYAAVGYLTTSLTTSAIIKSGKKFRIFQLAGAIFIFISCISSAYVPNPHWLFLTHTVLHGIGSSLILGTVGLVVNEHFDKNHKYHILATTLVSGGSVASIVFVQVYAYLIEENGWRSAFIILGVIYFFVCSTGALVFCKNPNKVDTDKNKNNLTLKGAIKSYQIPLLILWTCDRVLTSIVTYGMLLNLADYMHRVEKSLQKSALLTTLFAAGEASTYAIGAIMGALTKNLLKNRLKYILMGTTFAMSILLLLWEVFANNRTLSHIFAYLSGFCLGPSITFLFPAGEEMTLLPGHLAYPFSLAGMGLGMSLSPVLSALIAQMFYYKWFFMVQGFLMLLKFCCLMSSVVVLGNIAKSGENTYRQLNNDIEDQENSDFGDDSLDEYNSSPGGHNKSMHSKSSEEDLNQSWFARKDYEDNQSLLRNNSLSKS